ncbi:MAG TPA: beta-ketoacyl synthase N-terminal-like domain-containing protein, partial [Rhodopila sp.]
MNAAPIAIIGAACRLPGAPGLDALGELLFAGRDAVGEVPPGRWARELFYHPAAGQPGKAFTMAAGCIDAIDRFDAAFFGISAREAAFIDPQQRLLLELAHETLEDAGVPAFRLAGQSVGVFVGGSSWDYATIAAADLLGTDNSSMQGVALSSMSNRLSYQFDWRGPSLTIDTACSSSLVALHMACEAIRRSEVPIALVGGVNLILAPHPFVGFARAAMLSRRGRCQAFDAKADGYVRAEGGGAVLLKPLRDAIADGNPIRAVILASGVNSDGRTNGFSVPSTVAQERLLREVHARAGIAPDDISYLEAHGTGTAVGDPLEASAIGRALGRYRRVPLPIGSVKSNIGHLEAASGMAGLMKLIASLDRREIPASLHFETPNPHIPFAALKIEVVTAPRPMIQGAAGYVAGLNSFGFGGTNAHVVLAAPPDSRAEAAGASPMPADEGLPPLLLSARAPKALQAVAQSWQRTLTTLPPDALVPLLRGAARLRDHHPHRLAIPGAPAVMMASSLRAWLDDPDALSGHNPAAQGKVAFVFAGNGSQWPGMASDAITRSRPFQQMLSEVDAVLTPLLGWSVKARLRQPAGAGDLRDTAIAQPLLFAVQLGCVAALRQHGVVADAHVGHSVGEVAASWAAGALDLEQAARVIVARSMAQQSRHGIGGMAVLGLGAEDAAAAIARSTPDLAIAAINSARSVTIADQEPALAELQRYAEAMGWLCFPLDIDYAFHSAAMDPIRDTVVGSLAGLEPIVPTTMLVSTVTGQEIIEPLMDAEYWWRNVREPVRFSDAVETLIASGVHLFLEIGPQPVLQSYLHEAIKRSAVPGRVMSTLARSREETDPFPAIAARCYVAGCSLHDAPAFEGPSTPRGLPSYPWQRERFWHDRTPGTHEIIAPARDHPLLGYRQATAPGAWFSHPSTATERWLQDHVVDGAAVMPAAGMIEMALAAARTLYPGAASLELRDLEITRTLPLEQDASHEVTVHVGSDGEGLTIASRSLLSADEPIVHAAGRIFRGTKTPTVFDLPAGRGNLDTGNAVEICAATVYQAAAALQLSYGPAFRTVRRVLASGSGRAVVELDHLGVDRVAEGYLVDPALVDGALQGLIGLAATRPSGREREAVLPWRFGRVRLLRSDGVRPVKAVLHLRQRGVRTLLADIALLDADDVVVMELLECWFATADFGAAPEPAERMTWTALVPSLRQPDGAIADWLDPVFDAVAGAAATPETVILAEAMLALAARDAVAAGLQPNEHLLAPPADRRLAHMLHWLAQDGLAQRDAVAQRDGLAQRDGTCWRIAEATDLPRWQDVWRDLLFDVPAAAADAALAGAVAQALRPAGGQQATQTLPTSLVDQMLFASPTGGGAIDALLAGVEAWLDHWPAGRPLRVAEIGVAWPGLTRQLLGLLARRVPAMRYVALAADQDVLAALAESLADWPGATGNVWDRAAEQEEFDLVLGLYPF